MDQTTGRTTAAELLALARARIRRYEPEQAARAAMAGALLVDLRSDDERRAEGIVPGSLHVPRSVLEWRADPACPHANPALADLGRELILVCADGWSSSLAAAALVELGFVRVGDLVGGYRAWRAAGLPTREAPEPPVGLPGSGPPDS